MFFLVLPAWGINVLGKLEKMSCRVSCKGFLSVRAECARDPCLGMNNMCHLLDPDAINCSSWCCTSREWYIFFMVLFFGVGTFSLCAAYYLYRLHQYNVKSGAVTNDGQIVEIESPEEFPSPLQEPKPVKKVQVSSEIIKRLAAEP